MYKGSRSTLRIGIILTLTTVTVFTSDVGYAATAADLHDHTAADVPHSAESLEKALATSLLKARRTVNGRHFHFVTVQERPFVTVVRSKDGVITNYEGFCFEILNVLRDMYNFTYAISLSKDGTFGARLDNNVWSGMIGMILNNESDMGVGPFSFTYDRQQVIDYTTAFYEEPTTILIPPPTKETNILAVVRPFTFEVWMALLCIVLFLPGIICLTSNISSRWDAQPMVKCPSLKRHYEFVYGVLMTQSGLGSRLTAHSPSFVLTVIWCLIALVLINGYVGTLASMLSVPKLKPVIFSLEDLPTSRLTWVVRKGTDLDSLFTKAEEGIYKQIGDGLRRRPHLLTTSELFGPQQVLNGTSAFILGKALNEFFIESDYIESGRCRLALAKNEFYKAYQGFVLPKNSSLKWLFDKKIRQMLESGLTEYWRKKLWPKVNQCDPTLKKYGPRGLTLDDIQSTFLIWGIGTVLALVTFFIEHLSFIYARQGVVRRRPKT